MKPISTLLLLFFYDVFDLASKAQIDTNAPGSFIINMDTTNPNTIANGLKPYGLIYDVMKNHKVLEKWVIC
jgi:hypothetical protein